MCAFDLYINSTNGSDFSISGSKKNQFLDVLNPLYWYGLMFSIHMMVNFRNLVGCSARIENIPPSHNLNLKNNFAHLF